MVLLYIIIDLLLTAQYNGFIQFYDPLKDKSLYELNIVRKNPITQTGTGQFGVEILKFSTSNNRELLVTLELFAKETPIESYILKFWSLKNYPFEYILNSTTENPHKGKITALYVHPTKEIVVTGDNLGDFMIYKTVAVKYDDIHSYNLSPFKWICTGAGNYNDNKITNISLSSDGSILVISTENVITLWNVETITLIKTIAYEMNKRVKSISDLFDTEYFIIQLNDSIEIYSYFTGLPFIVLPIHSSVLKVDNKTKGQFGFISTEAYESSFVLYNIYSRKIQCLLKSPSKLLSFSFMFINDIPNVIFFNDNNELILLSQSIITQQNALSEETIIKSTLPTPYEQTFGITGIEKIQKELKNDELNEVRKFKNIKGKELKDYLNIPSHLLPLPSIISDVYFVYFFIIK